MKAPFFVNHKGVIRMVLKYGVLIMKEVIFNELSKIPAIGSLPEGVTVRVYDDWMVIYVPEGAEPARYSLSSSNDGSIEVNGPGHGDAYRLGSGSGDACRFGNGKGFAVRDGDGRGHAGCDDAVDGSSLRIGNGIGHAYREGDKIQ